MSKSHDSIPKPSLLLALICLALLQRLRPQWAAVSVRQAARDAQHNPERISRLASRAQGLFEITLATLTRFGRPPKASTHEAERTALNVALKTELLAVASAILARVSLRRPAVRALVVGAYLRLRQAHPALTQKAFCQALAIPERTVRYWLKQPPAPASQLDLQPQPPQPIPKRLPRRGRFAFNLTLPDTQQAADTTDLCAFGVPLKLIASQDIGGRDQDLFDSIIIDDHESSDLVVHVLSAALPGAQAIVDQGTPYMAQQTRAALDALGIEHAPQREGEPTDKATIERAFRTIKDFARPLLDLTNRVAKAVPTLRNSELAKAISTVILTALLRTYQAGARATRRAEAQRTGVSVEQLSQAAQQSRRQARAHDTSIRQLLAHIHAAYQIDVPLDAFLRTHRRFPLEVLLKAEREFGRQAPRGDIQKRASYFAAIVRACNDAYWQRQARLAAAREQTRARDDDLLASQKRHALWRDKPELWLRAALQTIAAFWDHQRRVLICGGVGAGTAWLRDALAQLVARHGAQTAADMAVGVMHQFVTEAHHSLGDDGAAAVCRHLREQTQKLSPATVAGNFDRSFAEAILHRVGPSARPPPPQPLRT
jgi:transposase InsO family protein